MKRLVVCGYLRLSALAYLHQAGTDVLSEPSLTYTANTEQRVKQIYSKIL
jgi:hypothetical protein